MIKHLRELVGFDTSSDTGKASCQDYVVSVLKALKPDFLDFKPGLYVYAAFGKGEGGLLVSGHLDVVPHPDNDAFQLKLLDGLYYGRGTCDMKGFIAVALGSAETLSGKMMKEPCHFCFTFDEELGMNGIKQARPLIERFKPAWALVGEPTMMQIVGSHLGAVEGTVKAIGKAAHSSEPENGISAVHAILEIMNFFRTIPGIGNIGIIKGGAAHNILAEEAEFTYQIRIDRDGEKIIEMIDGMTALTALKTGAAITHEHCYHPPLQECDSLSKTKMIGFLGAADILKVKYATESGFLQSYGVTPVVCGPGSIDQAHKQIEFCAKEQLDKCQQLMLTIFASLTL